MSTLPTAARFRPDEVEQSIPDRFEQQVRAYGDRIAVQLGSRALTYAELNTAANRLAHAILARRGKIEEPVAFILGDRIGQIVAILGSLKAGKIYVPVDPTLADAWISHMLEESQASLVLTDAGRRATAERFAKDRSAVLDVDALDAGLPSDDPALSLSPDRLAYILYTSGSTGQPKGVVQPHRNVLHNVMKYTNGIHIGHQDRLSLLYSLSFGASVSDTYGALLNGATLLPFALRERGVGELAPWLIRERVTIYHSVPTVFRYFTAALRGDEVFDDLRLIKLGGEPVLRKDVELYRRHLAPHCILHVGFGASEMAIIRQYTVDPLKAVEGSRVPVGHAVADTDIVLLDDAGRELPENAVGEIAIRSRYLSPGYWRRPDLTRAVYSEGAGGERTYRTGDLGRMLPGGCLEHLGRKDAQVKIRGQRIEVEAVESALADIAAIKDAIVLAREDRPDDQRLVAYVVPRQAPLPTVTELRRRLSEDLPPYMVPSAFVVLEAFPQTPNGKIDRQALPAPPPTRPALASPFVAPRTPIESRLAAIWVDVLGVSEVGVEDDFFDLGGHSLLATRVAARVRDAFGIEVAVDALFETPTLSGLALVLVDRLAEGGEVERIRAALADLQHLSEAEARRLLENKVE
jgi:amino acid adenylation domain-containing protein